MTSLIRIANERVPMPVACRAAGLSVPDVYRDSGTKCYCPWGEMSHSDGGKEKAFRVWPDHAWCFACRKWLGPVSLYAQLCEVTYEQAAIRLLDLIGYRPVSVAHLWGEAVRETPPDTGALQAALRNYCVSVAPLEALTLPVPAAYLARCNGYLTQVKDEKTAEQWLELAKTVMRTVLTGGVCA